MKSNSIKKFLQIRQALQKEKAELATQLQAIDEALGLSGPAQPTPMPVAPSKPVTRRPAGGGGMSLREAVVQVTSTQPLSKAEILKAVHQIGYRFQTKEPLKSLNPLLYGDNPKFTRTDGKFSPVGISKAGKPKATPAPKGKKNMDAAARAKLSAIAKARWAKAKKAGKSKL